jgi:hypothetical protein
MFRPDVRLRLARHGQIDVPRRVTRAVRLVGLLKSDNPQRRNLRI